MKKFSKQDQKLLAIWAADCAQRVLPFFEKAYPNDKRPRKAIQVCRKWVRTGVFKMEVIRKASLDAHAAARKAKKTTWLVLLPEQLAKLLQPRTLHNTLSAQRITR